MCAPSGLVREGVLSQLSDGQGGIFSEPGGEGKGGQNVAAL